MISFALPVAVFSVECEISDGRPFSETEMVLLEAIGAGTGDPSSLGRELALHPRVIIECLTGLFEGGMLELEGASSRLVLTGVGREALSRPDGVAVRAATEPRAFAVVVDRVTGFVDLARTVRYARMDELVSRGCRPMRPANVDPRPGRAALRRLVEGFGGIGPAEWVRSVGRPRPTGLYNVAIRVDVDNGRITGISSPAWRGLLADVLPEYGVDEGVLGETVTTVPDGGWSPIAEESVRVVRGSEDHHTILRTELDQAERLVFVHSAFLTAQCASDIAPFLEKAIERGVDVFLVRGLADNGRADDEGAKTLRRLAQRFRNARGTFYFEPEPSGSHAKLLIVDGARAYIGSFNWLSALGQANRDELSVSVSDSALVGQLCDIAADLFRGAGPAWPAQVVRSAADAASCTLNSGIGGQLAGRVILDHSHRSVLFRKLEVASSQLVVASERATERPDPVLKRRLERCATRLSGLGKLRVVLGHGPDSGSNVAAGVVAAGGNLQVTRSHAKYLIEDRRYALVTSFNLLSFEGRTSARSSGYEIGIELEVADGKASGVLETLFSQEMNEQG